jgi:hypothetical protein
VLHEAVLFEPRAIELGETRCIFWSKGVDLDPHCSSGTSAFSVKAAREDPAPLFGRHVLRLYGFFDSFFAAAAGAPA